MTWLYVHKYENGNILLTSSCLAFWRQTCRPDLCSSRFMAQPLISQSFLCTLRLFRYAAASYICHCQKYLNVLYYMPQSLRFVIVLHVPTNNVHSVHVVGSEKSYRKHQFRLFSLKSSNFQSSDPPTKHKIYGRVIIRMIRKYWKKVENKRTQWGRKWLIQSVLL